MALSRLRLGWGELAQGLSASELLIVLSHGSSLGDMATGVP